MCLSVAVVRIFRIVQFDHLIAVFIELEFAAFFADPNMITVTAVYGFPFFVRAFFIHIAALHTTSVGGMSTVIVRHMDRPVFCVSAYGTYILTEIVVYHLTFPDVGVVTGIKSVCQRNAARAVIRVIDGVFPSHTVMS